MTFLGYAYRFTSNFIFLAVVYYSLNLIEKYPQRATLALLILVYAAMHSASALRSFYFFQRIERLEGEARRLGGMTAEGPSATASRRQIVGDVVHPVLDLVQRTHDHLVELRGVEPNQS